MLLECPDCSQRVSNNAALCPGCGLERPGFIASRPPCKGCKSPLVYYGRGGVAGLEAAVGGGIAAALLLVWGLLSPMIYGVIVVALSVVAGLLGVVAYSVGRAAPRKMVMRCVGDGCKRRGVPVEYDAP